MNQSPRCWNSVLDEHLQSMGFVQTLSDTCKYFVEGDDPFIIAVYVDYMILVGTSDVKILIGVFTVLGIGCRYAALKRLLLCSTSDLKLIWEIRITTGQGHMIMKRAAHSKAHVIITITCVDLGEGPEEPRRPPPPPLFCRILQTIYKKNTEMNVQMPFFRPPLSRIGAPALTF